MPASGARRAWPGAHPDDDSHGSTRARGSTLEMLSSARRTVPPFLMPLAPPVLVVGLTAVLLIPSLALGQLRSVAGLLAFLFFAAATYYQPVPAVLLAILLSTDVLKFVDLSYLPYVQLGVGARINALDTLLLLLAAFALLRLRQRGERPLFLRSLQLLGTMVVLSFVLGLAAGTTTVNQGLNGLRALSGYLFYIGFVGVMDTPRKVTWLLRGLFVLALVSVAVQLLEASLGERLTLPTSSAGEYFGGTKTVEIDGLTAPYLWNRATGYLFVVLFLAASQAVWTRRLLPALLAATAVLGFVVALMRQWYVIILLGLLTVVLLQRKGRFGTVAGLLLLSLISSILILGLTSFGWLSSYPLLDIWFARLGTVANFQEEAHFIGRVDLWQEQLDLFIRAPLFGYGPGGVKFLYFSLPFGLADTGMPNTLLQFGIFGWLAIVVIIITYFYHAFQLLRALPVSPEQGYVAGLLGAWVGGVAGYSFGFDFFTPTDLTFTLTLSTGLLMALLDRARVFANASGHA